MQSGSGTSARRRWLPASSLSLILACALGCAVHDSSSFQSDDLEVEVGSTRVSDDGSLMIGEIEARATGVRKLMRFDCYVFDDRNSDQRVADNEVVRHYQCDGFPTTSLRLHNVVLKAPGERWDHISITAVGHFEQGEDVRVFVTSNAWVE